MTHLDLSEEGAIGGIHELGDEVTKDGDQNHQDQQRDKHVVTDAWVYKQGLIHIY